MKTGADWYKRRPNSYLGGVVGMTAKQHCVYSLVLDLLYAHGGEIKNNPAWIAGWIADMGAAAVRNTISELIDLGKLIENSGKITEKHAKNEAKTREELSEIGKNLAEKRWKKEGRHEEKQEDVDAKRINENDADKIREDKRRKEREDSPLPPRGGASELTLVPFDDSPDPAEEAFEDFKKLAAEFGLSTPRKLEPDRRKAIRARIAEHGAGAPAAAYAAIRASPFLRGEKGADGWRGVTFDWLFKPTNFRKVIEGNYDERSANQQSAALERLDATAPRRGQIEDIASLALRDFNRN